MVLDTWIKETAFIIRYCHPERKGTRKYAEHVVVKGKPNVGVWNMSLLNQTIHVHSRWTPQRINSEHYYWTSVRLQWTSKTAFLLSTLSKYSHCSEFFKKRCNSCHVLLNVEQIHNIVNIYVFCYAICKDIWCNLYLKLWKKRS